MKIQVVSDLHIEWGTSDRVFSLSDVAADILVFAGDIHGNPKKLYSYLKPFAEKTTCIVVLGNHEFYGTSLTKGLSDYKKHVHKTEENIHLLEGESFVLGDVVIHGGTLWTDFEPLLCRPHDLEDRIADFSLIKDGSSPITIAHLKTKFVETVKAFTRSFNLHPEKKHVFVTHHAPSHKSISKEFVGSIINPAFTSDLEWFIHKCNPALWIHGHTHSSLDYPVGDTRIICNPFGYFENEENTFFRKDLIVEI